MVCKRLGVLLALAAMALPFNGIAAEWPEPEASYQAVRVTEMNGEDSLRIAVRHDRGRERQTIAGEPPQVILVRPDLDSVYLIQEEGVGVQMPLEALGGDPTVHIREALNPQAVRTETVAGQPATKFRLSGANPLGGKFEGHAWATADGILLRLEGVSEVDGEPHRVEVRLEELERGPQEESLFSVPEEIVRVEDDPEDSEGGE